MQGTQRRLLDGVLVSLLGVGSDLIGVVDLFGSRKMIEDALPILGAFAPHFGVCVVLSTLFVAFGRANDISIRELDEIQRCGGEMMKWASEDPTDIKAMPSSQSNLRWIVLSKKYRRWLKNPAPERPNNILDLMNDAASCAETMRAYGYIRGRFIICSERRQWNRMIQESGEGQG